MSLVFKSKEAAEKALDKSWEQIVSSGCLDPDYTTVSEKAPIILERSACDFTDEPLSYADKVKVVEAAEDLYYLERDGAGNCQINLDASYNDTNEFLLPILYGARECEYPLDAVNDKIMESWEDAVYTTESEIISKALGRDDDAACDFLRETCPIYAPYDFYYKQDMKVNVMLGVPGEMDEDFTAIHNQYIALSAPDELSEPAKAGLKENSMLTYLLKQQGHTTQQLAETMKDYDVFFNGEDSRICYDGDAKDGKFSSVRQAINHFNQTHNPFLTSICQELENQGYSMGALTVLCRLNMEQYCDMLKKGNEITFPKDAMLGIFNPWNGSGSVLEIELEKPFTVSSDLIYDTQIEGAKPDFGYTLNNAYGLIESVWKPAQKIESGKKSLSQMISAAQSKATDEFHGQSGPEHNDR